MNKPYQKIVVKVGTSTLTHETGAPHLECIDKLVRSLTELLNAGREVILVTSGAIAVGVCELGLKERPSLLREKQAASAVGQCRLMHIYDKLAAEYGRPVAQILVTNGDFAAEDRKHSLLQTYETLLDWGVLPIVNENDSVSPEEIETGTTKLFGDNDTLSARVAALWKADLLVLLSDIQGLYTKNPREHADAELIPYVGEVTNDLVERSAGAGTWRGTGGMISKLEAGAVALESGFDMVITHGRYPETLLDIVYRRRPVGTLFGKTECKWNGESQ